MKKKDVGRRTIGRRRGAARTAFYILLPTSYFLLFSSFASGASDPPAEAVRRADAAALVARAEAKIRGAKTLSFRVLQRYAIEGLSTQSEEGAVLYARPNLLRWTYLGREEKVFVSDGKRVYFHLPSQNVVHATRVKDAAQTSPLLAFLFLNRPLARDYDFAVAERTESGEWLITASPKTARREEFLVPFLLHLSDGGEFRRVSWLDGAGGLTELYLSEIRYNPPLDASLFRFEIPTGAEIVEGLGFGE